MKILVIEDERAIRTLLKQAFEMWGHQVLVAEDGRLGLDAIRAHNPDVVFADLVMPELSGMDVLREARAGGFTRPFIMVTGSATTVDIKTAQSSGAFAVVLKPFRLDRLEELLKQLQSGPAKPRP